MRRTRINPMKTVFAAAAAAALALGAAMPAHAAAADPTMAQLLERLERLEARNAALEAEVHALHAQADAAVTLAPVAAAVPALASATAPQAAASTPFPASTASERRAEAPAVGISTPYSMAVLEHTEGVNKRLIRQLEARRDGELTSPVTLGGRIVAIADAHFSNRANKFGYLMRHPTGNNQRTFETQEIALSSVQLAATFTPARDFTGYLELLYDPEQSFGAGTITALTRNQVQLRKGYVMWGNLQHSPFYAALGKMDVPFGLEDSVSPFTNSTSWHAFAPLAYGGQAGLLYKGLSLRGMGIVGGAQFRGANTPVDGTNIPSKDLRG
jgi:cell pole-organizing protein PopZ